MKAARNFRSRSFCANESEAQKLNAARRESEESHRTDSSVTPFPQNDRSRGSVILSAQREESKKTLRFAQSDKEERIPTGGGAALGMTGVDDCHCEEGAARRGNP